MIQLPHFAIFSVDLHNMNANLGYRTITSAVPQ